MLIYFSFILKLKDKKAKLNFKLLNYYLLMGQKKKSTNTEINNKLIYSNSIQFPSQNKTTQILKKIFLHKKNTPYNFAQKKTLETDISLHTNRTNRNNNNNYTTPKPKRDNI